VGLDGLYYTGGRPTIDGKKGETRANARVGLTLTLPVNRYNSVKLYGSTGVYTKTGTDFDLVGSYGNSVGAGDFRVELLVAARGPQSENPKLEYRNPNPPQGFRRIRSSAEPDT
jgi:hypothetical protein